jgi:hypothetical protein
MVYGKYPAGSGPEEAVLGAIMLEKSAFDTVVEDSLSAFMWKAINAFEQCNLSRKKVTD